MAEQHDFERWRDIREIHKQNVDLYKRIGGFFVAGLLILFGIWIGRSYKDEQIIAFDLNLTTEFIGMVVTVGLFGLINQWQAERRYKQQLIDEAGSNSNEIARHAVYVMYRRKWRKGERSLLRGADLHYAQLQDADLSSADVSKANFERANLQSTNFTLAIGLDTKFTKARLQKAVMRYANLERADFFATRMSEANLEQANLRGTSFDFADLSRARLSDAKLQGATFIYTDLYGTDFQGANLEGAIFETEKFDRTTILPDNNNWFPENDMKRFTDPKHPDFWTSKGK